MFGNMSPSLIIGDDCQEAWVRTCRHLLANGGEASNLLVTIRDPFQSDSALEDQVKRFCDSLGLLRPRQVAYTLFPTGLARGRSAEGLFDAYNRNGGFFERVRHRHPGHIRWGTYFRRLTHYETADGVVNQLSRVIQAINLRPRLYSSAYTMMIQRPGSENVLPLGGPCLNYIALQVRRREEQKRIGLLAVYRNHSFLKRAYGNYVGLGHLLRFICDQTGSEAGEVHCLSSHAYVEQKRALRCFLDTLAI